VTAKYLCVIETHIDADSPEAAADAMWEWLRGSHGPVVVIQELGVHDEPIGAAVLIGLADGPGLTLLPGGGS